jgi:polysaccharide biosynthesis/export protein
MLTYLGEALRGSGVSGVGCMFSDHICQIKRFAKQCQSMRSTCMPALRVVGTSVVLILVATCGSAFAQATQTASAQAAQSDSAQSPASQTPGTHISSNSGLPVLQERHPRYQVMPSDVLAITFPLSPEINQTVTVQPDGFISLANLGSVYVQGQTTAQIVDTLTKASSKILHDPIIAVDLTNFQAPQFTVTGQVGKPGQYQLRYDTTVTQAIAVGGGFLPNAKASVFLFHRVSADWVEVKKLNVKQLMHGKNLNEDVQLQPGDMIFVPDEKFIANFRRYVPYSFGLGVSPLAVANSF